MANNPPLPFPQLDPALWQKILDLMKARPGFGAPSYRTGDNLSLIPPAPFHPSLFPVAPGAKNNHMPAAPSPNRPFTPYGAPEGYAPQAGKPFTPNASSVPGPPKSPTGQPPAPPPTAPPPVTPPAAPKLTGTEYPEQRGAFGLNPTAMGYADFQDEWDKLPEDIRAALDYKTARDMWGNWNMSFIRAWFQAVAQGKKLGWFQGEQISGLEAAKKIAALAKEEVSARRRAASEAHRQAAIQQYYDDQKWNAENMGYATSPRVTQASFGKV